MNRCKSFIGHHDPETCVFYQQIPGNRQLPSEEQLRHQWEQIEAFLTVKNLLDPPKEEE